ncbi:MAG: 30S ribosomal protein S6 [Candidatus Paceibacterota bacterium]
MKPYELVFITEKNDKETLNTAETTIVESKGKVSSKDSLGQKSFAYKIKGATEGYYHTWQIELSEKSIKDFKRSLNLNESIVRYLLLKR